MALLECAPLNALAQNWSGTLEGTVVDPSGKLLPGATVVLRNTATGQERQTHTDENGFYTFPLLAIGSYDLKISYRGFHELRIRDLPLHIAETQRIDAKLENRGQILPLMISLRSSNWPPRRSQTKSITGASACCR
jgi:hypothetical protein